MNAKEESAKPAPVITNLTWAAREYIWGPDYVDELVAQIAPGGAGMGTGELILYALTGHAGTVTALLDTSGNVQAQYSYDPYGELLAADVNPTMPRNRVGHQGLFFDRLNGNVMDPQLGRGFVGTYYNRNRTYAPGLGRFLQRDPNGAGSPLAMGDRGEGSQGPWVSVGSVYNDGPNIYAYGLSRPSIASDPSGRFGLVGGLMTGMDMADMAVDAMGDALSGLSQFMGVYGMVRDYMFNQELDAHWAEDWSAHDFEYSQSVVTIDYGGDSLGGISDGLLFGSGLSAEDLAARKPMQIHHIATNKGSHAGKFERLLGQIGINDLDFAENKVTIPHAGRHNREYHEWVLKELQDAIDTTPGGDSAKQAAVKKRLADIGKFLSRKDKTGKFKNASFLYNTVKGKQTKFAGKRKGIKWR